MIQQNIQNEIEREQNYKQKFDNYENKYKNRIKLHQDFIKNSNTKRDSINDLYEK